MDISTLKKTFILMGMLILIMILDPDWLIKVRVKVWYLVFSLYKLIYSIATNLHLFGLMWRYEVTVSKFFCAIDYELHF